MWNGTVRVSLCKSGGTGPKDCHPKLTASLQGYTNDAELDKDLWDIRQRTIASNPSMVLFDSTAKLNPNQRVKTQSPPQLPVAVTLAIREAAAKVFSVSTRFLCHHSTVQLGLPTLCFDRKIRAAKSEVLALFTFDSGPRACRKRRQSGTGRKESSRRRRLGDILKKHAFGQGQ